jgi:hypothetical protein
MYIYSQNSCSSDIYVQVFDIFWCPLFFTVNSGTMASMSRLRYLTDSSTTTLAKAEEEDACNYQLTLLEPVLVWMYVTRYDKLHCTKETICSS